MSDQTHKKHYGLIFISLFALTILEIFAANLPVSKTLIVMTLILFAVVKAALVAMFYMHLKFEKILLTVIGFAPLIFSVILTLMLGADLG